MPWETSNRRKDPPGWANTRRVVIERAQGQCQHQDEKPHATIAGQTVKLRCGFPGRDVDHIINVAEGGGEDLSNLQLLCEWHHKQKTQAEAKKNRPRRTERHPGEKHPGIIG